MGKKQRIDFILILVCVFIPVAGLFWVATQQERLEQDTRLSIQQANLEDIVANVVRLANPLRFFQERVERAIHRCIWDGTIPRESEKIVSNSLSLYLFDHSGKRLKFPGTAQGMNYLQ